MKFVHKDLINDLYELEYTSSNHNLVAHLDEHADKLSLKICMLQSGTSGNLLVDSNSARGYCGHVTCNPSCGKFVRRFMDLRNKPTTAANISQRENRQSEENLNNDFRSF